MATAPATINKPILTAFEQRIIWSAGHGTSLAMIASDEKIAEDDANEALYKALRKLQTSFTPLAVTDKQKEVLQLVVDGCTNRQIGEIMGIEPRTVKAHVAALMQKFNVKNRIQLAVARGAKQIETERLHALLARSLSRRQFECALGVREGLSNPQIADRLGIKEQVVKNYLKKVFDVTGQGNRLELAVYLEAIERGAASPPVPRT